MPQCACHSQVTACRHALLRLFSLAAVRSSRSACRVRCTLSPAGLPTIGDLTNWENVGKPTVVADLLKQRRDSDAAGGLQVESVVLPGATVDGDVLQVTSRLETIATASNIRTTQVDRTQQSAQSTRFRSDVHLNTFRVLSKVSKRSPRVLPSMGISGVSSEVRSLVAICLPCCPLAPACPPANESLYCALTIDCPEAFATQVRTARAF